MGQYPLNHYVILDGQVAEDALRVLRQWLDELNAQPLTDRIWIYSLIVGPGESWRRWSEIRESLRGLSPRADWQPFRILFLGPNGNGSYAYRMPAVSASGGGPTGGGVAFGS